MTSAVRRIDVLEQLRGGPESLDRLVVMLYDELRDIARRHRAARADVETLDTTALVHEAYLKLVDQSSAHWNDRAHFLSLAAIAMRHILVDRARARMSIKRGEGQEPVTIDEEVVASDDRPEALISIHHKLAHGTVSLTYSNIQTTIVGQPHPVIAESIGLTATYDLSSRLKFSAAPTAIRVTSETFKSTVYVSNLELTYQFTKELALKGSHQYSLMSGTFDPGTGPVGSAVEIPHNIFWLRLVLIVPYLVN